MSDQVKATSTHLPHHQHQLRVCTIQPLQWCWIGALLAGQGDEQVLKGHRVSGKVVTLVQTHGAPPCNEIQLVPSLGAELPDRH